MWRTAEVLATPAYCLLVMCISMPGPRLPIGPLARRFLCVKKIFELRIVLSTSSTPLKNLTLFKRTRMIHAQS